MYIAIDIGGTNTRIGISKNGRTFFAIEKFKTPARFEDGIRTITRTVLNVTKGQSLQSIAIAIPGPIDQPRGKVLHLPNLPLWRNKPIARALKQQLKAKVHLINDADAAGIGEATRGAGRGYRNVAYFTVSTGIGGARLINGKIKTSENFSAKGVTPKDGCASGVRSAWGGEPGHITLIPGGRKCGCGRQGCFEAYGSGTGFYKTYGIRTENCKDQHIWNEYAKTLGKGIIKTIADGTVTPQDIIIIGGGVSQVGSRLFKPLRAYIKNNLQIFKSPAIVPAKLGDLAGLYGCLETLK